jgi:hypothetical protein
LLDMACLRINRNIKEKYDLRSKGFEPYIFNQILFSIN